MKMFLKTTVLAAVMALFAACGSSNFEWFPEANKAPVADAGTNQSVVVGDSVTLDGSTSSDENGDKLTYSWAFTSKPTDSTATLSNATTVSPTFTTDKAGDYVLSLVVNDGEVSSTADSVTVTATAAAVNIAPVADAGPDESVALGAIVQLDGSKSSDTNGDELRYNWRRTSPSCGTLSSLTVVNPTLTGSTAGTCIIELQVFDHTAGSEIDTVTITVTSDTGSITVTW